MKLCDVLKGIDCTVLGSDDVVVTSVEYDSRKVQKGSLFIAVTGYQTDGHLYIEKAVANGAAAVICERDCDCGSAVKIITKDSREAMAVAGANFYGNSASRLKIIGVTGTNGKTTTTFLVRKIMEMAGIKTGLIGTNQNMIGDRVLETGRTTPESVDLHKLFAQMEEEGVTHVIMEVSSHALYLKRCYGFEFLVGAFTNLTRDHLDFHETFENYCDAKAILFKNCKKGVVNGDDEWAERIIKQASCPIKTYGADNDTDIKATDIRLSERGVIFSCDINGKKEDIRLSIPGKFSVYNALCALSVCLEAGISIEHIIKGLIIAKGVKGRAEVVNILADYTVIIDYAHTPDGLENIISTVRGFAKGRVITVFGCGGDRDKTKRPIMGEIAARMSDIAVVTSDNPRTENPEEIIKDILAGMGDMKDKYVSVCDRTKAIEYAMKTAKEGDVIILAGKGHETYQILGDKTIDYDERKIVKEIFDSVN